MTDQTAQSGPELPIEAPEADVAEQRSAVDPDDEQPDAAAELAGGTTLEAEPADVLEQTMEVPLQEEEQA